MLAPLDTPYADSRADALSFALGLPPLDALAVLPVERGGLAVELRLLGASHQVIARPLGANASPGPSAGAAGAAAAELSETVACLPSGTAGEPLPSRAARTLAGGWAYEFAAATERHSGDASFGRAVDGLRSALAGRDDDALAGTFPGSPHAVTALALDASGTGWRTWHSYPQTREIVMTRSRLVRRP
ncbi:MULTISPECIES: DUF2617 family protein [Actinomadura]|uniref:DUF2617 family protein n=1 Tax=Actinomadura yumaensis TaxID=111807 RepID=A0ABW2CBW2_9ACTN|nr:DUF2617 family protein [Actinomadura sp. J1-007]MWK33844.1 DUF2617 family protein [Actinomadura sp. J1-007]